MANHSSSKDKPRRPGDWDCPSCSAVVFASKMRCFKCMAPRPAHLEAPLAAGKPGVTRRACVPQPHPSHVPCAVPDPPRDGPFEGCTMPSVDGLDCVCFARVVCVRRGDWDCPNPSCRALVFASKTVCFRCGSAPAPLVYGMGIAQPAMLLSQGGMMQAGGMIGYGGGAAMVMQPVGCARTSCLLCTCSRGER